MGSPCLLVDLRALRRVSATEWLKIQRDVSERKQECSYSVWKKCSGSVDFDIVILPSPPTSITRLSALVDKLYGGIRTLYNRKTFWIVAVAWHRFPDAPPRLHLSSFPSSQVSLYDYNTGTGYLTVTHISHIMAAKATQPVPHEEHSHSHAFNAAEHGHSHEILTGPGSYANREMPIIAGRDWSERAFTVGIGG